MLVIGFPQIVSTFSIHLKEKMFFVKYVFCLQLNWLLIIYAQNPYYLYVSSIMGGVIGNGQIICLFIFVSEISYDK